MNIAIKDNYDLEAAISIMAVDWLKDAGLKIEGNEHDYTCYKQGARDFYVKYCNQPKEPIKLINQQGNDRYAELEKQVVELLGVTGCLNVLDAIEKYKTLHGLMVSGEQRGYDKAKEYFEQQGNGSDAVEFAEWLTDNGIISFFSKVTFGYHYSQFKLFKQ